MKAFTMEEVNGAGWTALLTTWFLAAVQWITDHGNGVIVAITGIMGAMFLYWKIKMIRLEYRERKAEIQRRKESHG